LGDFVLEFVYMGNVVAPDANNFGRFGRIQSINGKDLWNIVWKAPVSRIDKCRTLALIEVIP
ncbi:MAG: hypothetical protein WBW88_20495, partial [Rhodothermales bacterium]